jgi:hypothetical protein
MSIEQTLASMAHRQLTQTMPTLAPNLLGFELITNNDDNTFALGVNVAIIGDTYLYIPTILKNGRIAPVDLMYVPELDQFLPCRDAWLTYIQSKKTDLLAVLSKKKQKRSRGAGNVDLNMPFDSIVKVASDDISGILDHAKNAMVEAICSAPASFHIPCVNELVDHAPVNGLKKLASYIESSEGQDALAEFYTADDIKTITAKLEDKLKNAKTISFSNNDGTVKILTVASSEAKSLDAGEKIKILRDGAIIKDTRGFTPSTVYKTRTSNSWVVPAHDGVYELLKVDGTTLTAYVVKEDTLTEEVRTKHNTSKSSFYVIPLDESIKRKAYHVKEKDILGQPYPNTEDLPIMGSNISSIGSVDALGDVIIIDSEHNARLLKYFDFDKSVIRKDDETFIYRGFTDVKHDSNARRSENHHLNALGVQNRIGLKGLIIGKSGSKTRIAGDMLRTGSDSKYIEVSNYDNNTPLAIKMLADEYTMLDALAKRDNYISLSLFKADGRIYVDSSLAKIAGAVPIDAEYELVKSLAMLPEDAHTLVKEASRKPENYLVKLASETELMLSATDIAPEDINSDTLVLTPQMSEEDKHILDTAVKSGTKEVFDISILKMLAEEDAPDQIINEWIPALFTALDKLGRILYLCRAGESMQDVYGDARIEDVERKLRKQFNELGDIILTMLRGKVNDMVDLMNGDL